MPHGSRLSPDGSHHYSGCMMDDLLVEIDTRSLAVSRLFGLKSGAEGPVSATDRQDHAAMGHMMAPVSNNCSPTWAQPSADGSSVFVACNRSGEIAEVDVATWTLKRRWGTPKAPYNLAVTPDGRLLVATQKGPGTVSIWRLSDATMLAEIKGTRGVASGVVVSPDSRYAFATMEGVGGQPGTVDIIDLVSLAKVASVDMGKQAGGIAVLP
jgi:DNA-binding beta-propeller fold protein YncE